MLLLDYYSAPRKKREVLCCVCLFVRKHISGTTVQSSQDVCACYLLPCVGPPLVAASRYVFYFRFYGDVVFAHNGPYMGISIQLQRVTPLHRRAPFNAPAASYWFRRAVTTVGGETGRVQSPRGAGDGVCNAVLPCFRLCFRAAGPYTEQLPVQR